MTTGDVVRYAGHRWKVLVVHATCCYIARRGYERWVSRALVTPWGKVSEAKRNPGCRSGHQNRHVALGARLEMTP